MFQELVSFHLLKLLTSSKNLSDLVKNARFITAFAVITTKRYQESTLIMSVPQPQASLCTLIKFQVIQPPALCR